MEDWTVHSATSRLHNRIISPIQARFRLNDSDSMVLNATRPLYDRKSKQTMLIQILIGTVVIFITIVIQVLFIDLAIKTLTHRGVWLVEPPFVVKTTLALVAVVLWLIAGISLSTWAWAAVFLLIGVFQTLEPALYFSIVNFTTLGYGDIILDTQWRILASFSAVNGLIVFGLNTAFLVEFLRRVRSAQRG